MPEWLHSRAEHLLAKNPEMPKSEAFAIATQQSHALGKTPKDYGTERGRRVAKRKFDTPKDDVKKANPGGLDSPKLAEVDVTGLVSRYRKLPTDKLKRVAERIGSAKERLHGAKIYPLEGKLSPGGMLDMAGGEHFRKGQQALESARGRYTDLSRAQHAARQAVFEASKGASIYPWMRAELAKLADLIPGGKADGKTDKDFDKRQLAMGEEVEQEHAKGDRTLAREIARDHLQEIPDYYSRLKLMEDAAPKRKEAMDPDHPYLLDQVGKPKVRNLSAMPPDKSLVVKKAAATGVFGLPLARDPMAGTGQKAQAQKRLAQSQKIGVPEPPKPPKTTPLSIKTGALSYHGMRTALGAGIGAAAGAGMGAAHAEQGHRLHGALYGAAAGGTVGGTVGYAAPKYLASRAGTINRRTGEMVVAPASRMEALRHVGQAARHDIGSVAQSAGQGVQNLGQQMQQTGNRMQYGVRKELAAARPVAPAPSQMVTGAASPMALAKAAEAKLAFTESMYSGGTSIGGNLVHTNIIPPFRNPPVKTAGPPPPSEKDVKMAAMADELMKLNAVGAITPAGRLAQSRKVGQPKTTAPPGPSIAQIAKPVGYGSPEPGTTKTGAPSPKAWA